MDNTMFRPVYWDYDQDCLMLLDQRRLPAEEKWLKIRDVESLVDAIMSLAIRGAPLLGVAAAYGIYLGVRSFDGDDLDDLRKMVDENIAILAQTRPTAVNLFQALRRTQEIVNFFYDDGLPKILDRYLTLALKVLEEEEQSTLDIGQNGADYAMSLNAQDEPLRILTHCNTGALACGGIGTALGVIYELHQRGMVEEVLVDETRPLLQGGRLTAWELKRWGIPFRVLPDSAAPYAMLQEMVDMVIVGADRIARNGDVANKIGTYSLALAAKEHGIPFVVAAPSSTFDLSTMDMRDIPIEQRPANEVLSCMGHRIAPEGVGALNPAFDATPSHMVTTIVTEMGVVTNVSIHTIADHIARK